jgi:hypothetical protein
VPLSFMSEVLRRGVRQSEMLIRDLASAFGSN